jgi:hypothetical protein
MCVSILDAMGPEPTGGDSGDAKPLFAADCAIETFISYLFLVVAARVGTWLGLQCAFDNAVESSLFFTANSDQYGLSRHSTAKSAVHKKSTAAHKNQKDIFPWKKSIKRSSCR